MHSGVAEIHWPLSPLFTAGDFSPAPVIRRAKARASMRRYCSHPPTGAGAGAAPLQGLSAVSHVEPSESQRRRRENESRPSCVRGFAEREPPSKTAYDALRDGLLDEHVDGTTGAVVAAAVSVTMA
ncbi:unnamed protein product [Arctogadus glacialis]